jgi:hypothetical protein
MGWFQIAGMEHCPKMPYNMGMRSAGVETKPNWSLPEVVFDTSCETRQNMDLALLYLSFNL